MTPPIPTVEEQAECLTKELAWRKYASANNPLDEGLHWQVGCFEAVLDRLQATVITMPELDTTLRLVKHPHKLIVTYGLLIQYRDRAFAYGALTAFLFIAAELLVLHLLQYFR